MCSFEDGVARVAAKHAATSSREHTELHEKREQQDEQLLAAGLARVAVVHAFQEAQELIAGATHVVAVVPKNRVDGDESLLSDAFVNYSGRCRPR
jgi:hypothetical protein